MVVIGGAGCESDHDLYDDGAGVQGRWTRDEHKLFLEAIQLYGREWRMVQTAVKTRTSAQIRSHAQKYFQKLSKQEPARFPSGACEDAFLIMEMCERVLHTLKQKRDDILQRKGGDLSSSAPSSDDHGGTYDHIDLDLGNAAVQATATARAWCVPAKALTLALCRDSSALADDELVAVEVLCDGWEFVQPSVAVGVVGPGLLDCGAGDGTEGNPMAVRPTDVFEYGFQWAQKGAVALHIPTRGGGDASPCVPGDVSRKKRPLQINPLYYATNLALYRKRLKPL